MSYLVYMAAQIDNLANYWNGIYLSPVTNLSGLIWMISLAIIANPKTAMITTGLLMVLGN